MLDQTPASSLEKVSWKEVIQIGEQVSKQATMGLSLSLSCFYGYFVSLMDEISQFLLFNSGWFSV